jgi:hypothetical protein
MRRMDGIRVPVSVDYGMHGADRDHAQLNSIDSFDSIRFDSRLAGTVAYLPGMPSNDPQWTIFPILSFRLKRILSHDHDETAILLTGFGLGPS